MMQICKSAQAAEIGVLLLGADKEVRFADAHARSLLGWTDSPSEGEQRRRWAEIRQRLTAALNGSAQTAQFEIDTAPDGKRLCFAAYRTGALAPDGYLMLVRDGALLDTLEADLFLANQLCGLISIIPGIAHDLRGPLNTLAINLELLKETMHRDGGIPSQADRQTRYVTAVKDAVTRLNQSFDRLFAEIDSPSDVRRSYELRELVLQLEKLISTKARLQRVQVTVELPEHPVPVSGDRARLKQALLNVILNAVEAMPNGGKLSIQLQVRDEMAEITIGDSGPGIDPAIAGRIGTPHCTTKSNRRGMGLYIALAVLRPLGGDMDFSSQPGQGTCVRVSLPLARGI